MGGGMTRKKVQCIGCGFLSLRPPEVIRELTQATQAIDFYGEFTEFGREAIRQEKHKDPQLLACRRYRWNTEFPQ